MFSFKYLILYFLTLVVFLVIDFFWLGIVAKNLYQREVGELLSKKVRIAPAFLTYILLSFGMFFFAVLPALKEGGLEMALVRGALFGLISYGVYDLTNLSTLAEWTVKVSVIDILWGIFISTLTSLASFKIGRFFGF